MVDRTSTIGSLMGHVGSAARSGSETSLPANSESGSLEDSDSAIRVIKVVDPGVVKAVYVARPATSVRFVRGPRNSVILTCARADHEPADKA